jgi:hypothetical protein
MTFGLKNADATYQRAMNLIFHDLLRVLMVVYINDVVVKSIGFKEHMTDLKLSLERMKKYGLRMNPLMCVFRVTSERFLGFVVHEHGIQDPNKIESVGKIGELVCKKGVQKLLSKTNYLHHFISNLAGRVVSLLPLVRLKHDEDSTFVSSKTATSLRENQRVPCVSTCVASSEGWEPVQDAYCRARMGY